MHASAACPGGVRSAAGRSHDVGAAGGLYLRRGRCPPSPPTRGRWGAAFVTARRCATASTARTHARSAPSYGSAHASCGLLCALRSDYARRGARWRRRPDRPGPWRRCRRHCRRRRRRRCLPEPRERPRRRRTGLGVTDILWPVLLHAAGDTESPRSGSRRARPGLAVTHGHADAGHGPGEARLPPYTRLYTL